MSGSKRYADVAVVGAGIIGCLIAREVTTRAPGTSVVVLDRDGAGSGASRRSAGLHMPRGGTPRVRQMAAYSQDYYDKLGADRPELPIFRLKMMVLAPLDMEGRLRETYLDSAAPTRMAVAPHADVRVPEGVGVWRVDGGQYADVYGLVQALTRDLRPRATLLEGVRVAGIEPVSNGVLLRLGTGDELLVGRVVVAPGPWLADPAWSSLVAPSGIRVKKIVALHVERPSTPDDQVIVFEKEDAFLLPLAHRGHWLFSYTCQEWDVEPDAVAEGVAGRHLDQARTLLASYAPALAEHCVAGRVFCDAYSPDWEPVVRMLDESGRIIFAGAANGSGYRLAPAIASSAADLLHLQPGPRSSNDH